MTNHRQPTLRSLLSAFPLLLSLTASAQSVILGVLEDVPPVHAGDSDKPAVRALFHFEGDKWIAFPNDCPNQECLRSIVAQYPASVHWSIGSDGREIAQLTSRTPTQFDFYSHVGLQNLDEPSRAPRIGSKSREFSGFLEEQVYRPLVANTQPFFSDPDRWTDSPAPARIQNSLRRAFRREFPELCKRDQNRRTTPTPFAYSNAQVRINKALQSKPGIWIAQVHPQDAGFCDDAREFEDPWFVARPDGSADFLGQGMWLVGTGDFNNLGSSEILFSIDRYNRGGYELFYDQLTRHVSFEFGFH